MKNTSSSFLTIITTTAITYATLAIICLLAVICGGLLIVGGSVTWLAYEHHEMRRVIDAEEEKISNIDLSLPQIIDDETLSLLPRIDEIPEPKLDAPELIPLSDNLEETPPPENPRPLLEYFHISPTTI